MPFNDKDIHSQSKKIIHNVYTFLKNLSKKTDLTSDFFKSAQDLTSQAYGISILTLIILSRK
ncbi:DDE 3 domain-containing protein [Aphis craccivora]|uniref:DDE 3 domain-containing protein n=1 Tax=Aphis craccivora TaxID=307492 RepID=A0A6G0Y7Z8_APHCR|nr:DDE 3 domain-containing protein [Aphis craccivora]